MGRTFTEAKEVHSLEKINPTLLYITEFTLYFIDIILVQFKKDKIDVDNEINPLSGYFFCE